VRSYLSLGPIGVIDLFSCETQRQSLVITDLFPQNNDVFSHTVSAIFIADHLEFNICFGFNKNP
jgi:hypothetical protein